MHSSRKSCLLRPAVVPSATATFHFWEHTLALSPLMLVEPDGRLDGEDDSGAAAACGPSCIMSPEPCSVLGVPWLEACAKAQGEASTRLSAAAANSIVFMEYLPVSALLTAQPRACSRARGGTKPRATRFTTLEQETSDAQIPDDRGRSVRLRRAVEGRGRGRRRRNRAVALHRRRRDRDRHPAAQA